MSIPEYKKFEEIPPGSPEAIEVGRILGEFGKNAEELEEAYRKNPGKFAGRYVVYGGGQVLGERRVTKKVTPLVLTNFWNGVAKRAGTLGVDLKSVFQREFPE